MGAIHLQSGFSIDIDDQDLEWANTRSWFSTRLKSKRERIVCIQKDKSGKKTTITLSRTLYKERIDATLADNLMIAYKDGNGLNNRRDNLVPMTKLEMVRHYHKVSLAQDRRGVRPRGDKFEAFIRYQHQEVSLGKFDDEWVAKSAYRTARQHISDGKTPFGKPRDEKGAA